MLAHKNTTKKPLFLFSNPHRPSTSPSLVEFKDNFICYNDNPDADLVIDVGILFSKHSRNFDPSKRGLVIVEPQGGRDEIKDMCLAYAPDEMVSDLKQKIVDYYGFAIFWWHDQFRDVPQFCEFTWTFSFLANSQFGIRDKKFGVGGVVSPRDNGDEICFPGYTIRHELLDREMEINIPGMVYNYRKSWKGKPHDYPIDSKSPAFDWTHHLAIENCREAGYFSEKILDCFVSYTIPIYFGDPRILEKFDKNGIIIVGSTDEILDILSALTPDDYLNRMEAMNENYHRALKLTHPDKLISKLIIEQWERRSL